MNKQPRNVDDLVKNAFKKVTLHAFCKSSSVGNLKVWKTTIDEMPAELEWKIFLAQGSNMPAQDTSGDVAALQKAMSLLTKQPKTAEDLVKTAFRKVTKCIQKDPISACILLLHFSWNLKIWRMGPSQCCSCELNQKKQFSCSGLKHTSTGYEWECCCSAKSNVSFDQTAKNCRGLS